MTGALAALSLLVSVLSEGGGMGIMVYGRYGRTGVYEAQQALRLLDQETDDDQTRIDRARRFVDTLPPTNWLKKNTLVSKLIRVLWYPVGKLLEFKLTGTLNDPKWYLQNFSGDVLRKIGLMPALEQRDRDESDGEAKPGNEDE